MKRLIVSVLMLMAATLIFSQANDELEGNAVKEKVSKSVENTTVLG
ncbi:hypothetical protein ACW5R3_05300 [Bizionia sp. KMM 8389]